jgi:2-keto-3-deoxy-L-rhamnonate aldolase RhmA
MRNELKRRLYHDEVCYGTWIASASLNIVDILTNFKFDWFVIDIEHSAINPETVGQMMQVIDEKVTPIVRVGANDQYLIKLALDAGAYGVVVPLVNSREEAEMAVRFSKYPPEGNRGRAGTRASHYGLNRDYFRTANDETMVIVQIETKEALKNIDEILGVKGIDVAFVGPSDLTMSLGLFDDRSNERVVSAMRTVVKACKKHGKIPGIFASSIEEMENAVDRGFKFISLGSDIRFLMQGARTFLKSVGRD